MQIQVIQQSPGQKASKYKNKKCIVNGFKFPSIKEARRYVDLYYLQKAGKIFKLELQPVYKIEVNGVKLCTYRGDFKYYNAAGALIVEDVKGLKTPVYKLKKQLLFATTGIEIKEI